MPRVTKVETADTPAVPAQETASAGYPSHASKMKPLDPKIASDGMSLIVLDRMGRMLTFRKILALEKTRIQIAITMAFNAEVAKNEEVVMTYSMSAALEAINGTSETPWMTLRDLDLRVQTLGDEGMMAAALVTPLLYKGLTDEEVKAVAKKYQATPK
jgi:hypothetical protein